MLGISPRINHVGGGFDDLPERTVGTVVVDAPSVVWAHFFQHAEPDEPAGGLWIHPTPKRILDPLATVLDLTLPRPRRWWQRRRR